MATRPEDDDTATLERETDEGALDADEGLDAGESDGAVDPAEGEGSTDGEEGEEQGSGEEGQPEEEGLLISLDGEQIVADEVEPEAAKPWVNELRKNYREQQKELRKAREEIARLKGSGGGAAPVADVVVGEKPVLKEYADADEIAAHEKALLEWNARKAEADRRAAEREATQKAQQEAWQRTLQTYEANKSKLKVADFETSEDAVRAALNVEQQCAILHVLEKPEVLIYALGKSPKRLAELAAIKDAAKFIAAVAKLETKVTTTTRKAPTPERKIGATGTGTAATTANLDRLREEARRTGNWDNYFKAKRKSEGK